MKAYRINPVVKENEPVKYNRVDIRFEKCGLIRIDGYFEAKRIETAYNRLCRALEQAAADMPALNGWKELPAKKLVQTEDGTWENENGDTIFYTDPQGGLAVDIQDNDTFYIFGNYKMELNGINPADVPLADGSDTEPVEVKGKKIMPATAATGQETNANNHADDTTNRGTTQENVAIAAHFFDLLFGNVTGNHYGYLWTKQDKATYPFKVTDATARKQMAQLAIELNNSGKDVYVGVNLGDEPAAPGKRYTKEQITIQTAIITDIDVEGGGHISNAKQIYPPNFNVAKSFLPFAASLVVDSGYGLHDYCLFDEPLAVVDDNREDCIARNKRYIEAVRARAGVFSKAVDGVHDLPRVLRCPGTFNFKAGKTGAPLCKLVEVNDIRFTPADLDARLAASEPPAVSKQPAEPKAASTTKRQYQPTSDEPSEQERARAMLAFIPCAEQTYEDWVAVGMILKNNGNDVSDWTRWSRDDSRFKDGETERKWQGFTGSGLTIATLHRLAQFYGYDEKSFRREWYNLRGDRKPSACADVEAMPVSADLIYESPDRTGGTVSQKTTVYRKPAPIASQHGEDSILWTQDRIRSCPVNLRLPDDFIFGVTGITKVIRSNKPEVKPKYKIVARTAVIPGKKYRDPLKGTVEYEFLIFTDGEWCKVEIDGASLADLRDLAKTLSKHGALIDYPFELSQFINAVIALNSGTLPRLDSYNQTGWSDEEFEAFALPADGKSVVRRPGYDYERIFKSKGSPEAWKEKLGEIVAQGGDKAKIVIGFAAAAPLVRPLNLHNLQLHLHGRKSIGKTPLERFAVSIFGDADVNALSHTFSASPKSRLEMAAAFRDLPLICEELESISQREAETFVAQDIYNYFLGIGGQALKKDGTRREPKIFSGARLTSGEHSLVQSFGNAGEFKRVLEIRCASLLDEDFAADLYEFVKKNRGLFGAQWIRYITEHKADISKDYNQMLKIICAEQKDNGNENDRTQLATLVAAAVGYQHFRIAIGLQKSFNTQELDDVVKAIASSLPTKDEIDDTTRAITFLKSFIVGNEKYFYRTIRERETGRKRDICHSTNEAYGKFVDNGDVAFLPHSLNEILLKGKFKSPEKLIAEFVDKGYLRCNDKSNTYPTKFDGKTTRTIRFKAGVLAAEDSEDRAGSSYNSGYIYSA